MPKKPVSTVMQILSKMDTLYRLNLLKCLARLYLKPRDLCELFLESLHKIDNELKLDFHPDNDIPVTDEDEVYMNDPTFVRERVYVMFETLDLVFKAVGKLTKLGKLILSRGSPY